MKKILLTLALALFFISPAQAMNAYNTGDAAGFSANTPPIASYINVYAMAVDTSRTITWPTNTQFALVNCSAAFWFSLNSSIATPTVDITNGTGPTLGITNQVKIRKGSETAFYMVSHTVQLCSVSFYANQI